MSSLNSPIRDHPRFGRSVISLDPAGHLAVCSRAYCRDLVEDGMLGRTSGKFISCAGELVVPELLDAVR